MAMQDIIIVKNDILIKNNLLPFGKYWCDRCLSFELDEVAEGQQFIIENNKIVIIGQPSILKKPSGALLIRGNMNFILILNNANIEKIFIENTEEFRDIEYEIDEEDKYNLSWK